MPFVQKIAPFTHVQKMLDCNPYKTQLFTETILPFICTICLLFLGYCFIFVCNCYTALISYCCIMFINSVVFPLLLFCRMEPASCNDNCCCCCCYWWWSAGGGSCCCCKFPECANTAAACVNGNLSSNKLANSISLSGSRDCCVNGTI